jgi:hypothetical protein
MYALVSPNELSFGGYRVAEVAAVSFEVAEPLFWVECNDEVVADMFYYDTQTQTIIAVPQRPIPLPDVTEVTEDAPNVIA